MASYDELRVWQRAMDLAAHVYELTRAFPQSEVFGITSQLRRSAVSVPSNIAEGHGRGSPQDFLRFLAIARGSLSELETQLKLAFSIGYLASEQLAVALRHSDDVGALLNGLQRSLRESQPRRP